MLGKSVSAADTTATVDPKTSKNKKYKNKMWFHVYLRLGLPQSIYVYSIRIRITYLMANRTYFWLRLNYCQSCTWLCAHVCAKGSIDDNHMPYCNGYIQLNIYVFNCLTFNSYESCMCSRRHKDQMSRAIATSGRVGAILLVTHTSIRPVELLLKDLTTKYGFLVVATVHKCTINLPLLLSSRIDYLNKQSNHLMVTYSSMNQP